MVELVDLLWCDLSYGVHSQGKLERVSQNVFGPDDVDYSCDVTKKMMNNSFYVHEFCLIL